MLWQTIRAYFLPSAHPGLQPVKDRQGEEFRPKRDGYGRRVERDEWESVWDGYEADQQRARNRALVRPFMGVYMRRWAGLGLLLWIPSELFQWSGLPLLSWPLFLAALGSFLMVFLLFLLREEMSH
ncbi:hypothetical protein [Thiohalorhabdus methylotrophus]|uniref:Uncharacterized protein n=1 Tax=Thiohalorhabdus methylotrophus TaxID=3242694 RepID=A0ABV4TS79_9GAMM